MYWNTINRFSNRFMAKYKYPPSVIVMSWLYYINVQKEMNDNEKCVLTKTGRAKGCKIITNPNLDEKIAFVLLGNNTKTRLYCYIHEIK